MQFKWLITFFLLASCSGVSPGSTGAAPPGGKWVRKYGEPRRYKSSEATSRVEKSELQDAEGAWLVVTKFYTASPGQAQALLADRTVKLRSIYDPHIDPYFAYLTRSTSCPERFQLRSEKIPRKDNSLDIFTMFANDRNTVGACAEGLVQKKAARAFLVCGSMLLQVEKFVPLKNWDQRDDSEIRSVVCPD